METEQQKRPTRFQAGLAATIVDARGPHECNVLDLSRSGALLEGELGARPGDTIAAELHSVSGDLRLGVRGKISRIDSAGDDDAPRFGLAFEPLAAGQERVLDSLIARLIEGLVPPALAKLPEGAHVAEIRAALQATPLGHRMTLARRAALPMRRLLVHDPTPQVIEALVRNPQQTAPELKRLARRSDFPQIAAAALVSLPRWAGDEELQAILASHARTPLPAALLAAGRVGPRWAEQALRRSGLQPAVRTRLLERAGKK